MAFRNLNYAEKMWSENDGACVTFRPGGSSCCVCRFFFLVEKGHLPLELTVTPCASPIVWSLQRQPPPPRDFYDEPRGESPPSPLSSQHIHTHCHIRISMINPEVIHTHTRARAHSISMMIPEMSHTCLLYTSPSPRDGV